MTLSGSTSCEARHTPVRSRHCCSCCRDKTRRETRQRDPTVALGRTKIHDSQQTPLLLHCPPAEAEINDERVRPAGVYLVFTIALQAVACSPCNDQVVSVVFRLNERPILTH